MSATLLASPSDQIETWRDEEPRFSKTERRDVPLEQVGAELRAQEEFDIEIDYGQTRFPVEGDLSVHVADPKNSPIRLGYRDEAGTLEVIDWGVEIQLANASDLPRLIGRRFLELYSKAVTGALQAGEREWLRKISEQMDYHSFAAARKLPRYREATLVRKSPVFLVQFIEDANVKLDIEFASKLHTLEPGDRFSAWFTLNGNGDVVDFQHVLLLPTLEDSLGEEPEAQSGVALSPGLAALLPVAEH